MFFCWPTRLCRTTTTTVCRWRCWIHTDTITTITITIPIIRTTIPITTMRRITTTAPRRASSVRPRRVPWCATATTS